MSLSVLAFNESDDRLPVEPSLSLPSREVMKFPAFDYKLPASLSEAIALLADHGDDAMLLAGGQSLMPILAFRMAAPTLLIDLKNVPALDCIDIGVDGITLGARVRWRDIEGHAELVRAHPLLSAATRHIAHYQIRNRGTVVGSLALADPAAELPGVAVTCDARLTLFGPGGERDVAAEEFFLGPMTTDLAADEILTAITFPAWPERRRWAFREFARRRGDFALAGIALHYDLDEQGRARDVHIGVIGACDRPHRLRAAEAAIDGTAVDEAAIAIAAEAASSEVSPIEDHHAPPDYRRALVATLIERALQDAAS